MSDKLKIEKFKKLTISRIDEIQKPKRTYSIGPNDLLFINSCPLCKSKEVEIISEVHIRSGLKFFQTALCKKCAFVFRSISPSFKWFLKCWSIIDDKSLEVFNPEAEPYKAMRYEIYLKILKSYTTSGKTLEIGAGYGTGSKMFKDAGFSIEVIESEISKARYIRKKLGIPVVGNNIEKFFKRKHKLYDLLVFVNCLEHLDHPVSVMQKISSLLKPNGLMIFSAPIIWDSISWTDSLYMTHKVNFSIEHLMEIAAQNKFEILEMVRVPAFHDNSWEIAVVVRPIPNTIELRLALSKQEIIRRTKLIQQLYRKNLPFKFPEDRIMRFRVPFIDQFFQTINLSARQITQPKNHGDSIDIF